MAVIQNNHVAVSLVAEDEKIMASIMQGCPIQRPVRPEDLECTIIYADKPIYDFVPQPGIVHSAVITGAQMWYDPVMKIRDLVVTLDAPTLVARRDEIMRTYGVESLYGEHYFPHMALVYNMPDFSSSYKWWINNILNDFNGKYKNFVLRFDNETIESTSIGFNKSGDVKTDDAQVTNVVREITKK